MTNDPCIPLERLASVVDAPAGSAERAHLESCPRCQAQLLALRAFIAPPSLPTEAKVEDAEIELDRFIGQITAQPAIATPRQIITEPGSPGWLRWFAPGPRLALAAAMLAVVVAGAWMAQGPTRERALTRGGPMGTSDAGEVTTSEPTRLPDGWLLEWEGVEGATGYVVLVLGSDLTERARFDAGPVTHLTVVRSALPEGLDSAEGLAWQVEARRGADVVSRSAVAELPRP